MRAVGLFSLLLAAFLPSLTTGFVMPTSSMISQQQQQRLLPAIQMMDPSHWMETASSLLVSDDAIPAPGEVTYSKASYYTVLALYMLSFPGLWSQIKRSTTAKVKRKTYVRYE